MSMLTTVVNHLDKLDKIIDHVKSLAVRHTKYGVTMEHYDQVGSALIWTLEKGLGEHWNEELKHALIKAYTSLSGVMIEASA